MVAPQSTPAVPNVSGMGSQDHSGPCAFANVPQLGHEELNRWRLVPVMLPCSFQTASPRFLRPVAAPLARVLFRGEQCSSRFS
jgi:hypothetical protein